ncbi:cytochrome oxidase assembly protein ShyY1 [Herbihabitans rhizosphaerae]|uniref:SURF1-like protein n=1 Tax=Herbihabitans rhizosphaerae TaxID=1872711 RepID=A0A4Q7L3I5_9PSEU|nr:SURF1 family cytochrome oxidase biogenesis protein [Herbihabitans rhizosphaerae]RZS44168.1 cytochrome oxidase assembly protein ShyY1 [Herbihabitans rhizosphaerae]
MRLKSLLRPGWLALTLVVLLFAIACYTLLAPWQFRRHDERKVSNDALTSSMTADPVALAPGLPEWKRVRVTGEYLPAAQAVARLRTVDGVAAFEVLTPFRTTDGTLVLIDRGFLRPAEGVHVPRFAGPPAGQVELTGRVRPDETDPQGRDAFSDATTDGHRQVHAVDSRTVGRATSLHIRPGYLQLESGSPGVLGPMPLPQLDAGPFLSYALQWLAFGTMALLAWLYFTWREIRPGGVLAEQNQTQSRRRSVAELVAEDEAAEKEAESHQRA